MSGVPGRTEPAAAPDGPVANGHITPPSEPVASEPEMANGSAPALVEDTQPLALPAPATAGPQAPDDPGLYAVLGLSPSASDAEILTTYRRQAARLLSSGATNTHAMRELNVAYEVLGNSVRRAEYDRLRIARALQPGGPTPIRTGAKATRPVTRRTRPRHAVQPRYPGLPDALAVLMVVGLAVLAGALIIPRLSINLSALNVLQNVLPLTSSNNRRVVDTPSSATPGAATPAAATATPRPGIVERFAGTNVSVSAPTPSQNTSETVVVRLRRDGQPATNFDVWAVVQYRTVEERWPATGSVKTDGSGTASISFNVGSATPNYPVEVKVFAQVDDSQQLTWATSFTPR
jgi:hypothetical protein